MGAVGRDFARAMATIEWGADLETALDQGRRERRAVLLYFGKDP